MLLLAVLGSLFVSNEHYHQLLGNTIKHVGGGLIFTGLLYLLADALGYYGARTQNKCLLIMLFVLLAVLLFLQTVFGSVTLGKSIPSLAHGTQVACLTLGLYDSMTIKQQQECDQFLHSDDFVGMTLVWQSYYTNSIAKGPHRAMVLNFQKEHFCCGNGLPSRCSNDTRAFPASYPSTAISAKVWQRITCDSYGTMAYAATRECNANSRCEYDLPYGSCGLNPVTTTTRGCGAFVFANLSTQVEAIAIIVLVSLTFPISFIVASLCLCFKRRDEDVLPSIEFAPKVRVYAEG